MIEKAADIPFWQSKSLSEMNKKEWESLCDGCAKCCLHKLEDQDSGEVAYTRVVCRYLQQQQCRCTVYTQRKQFVPTCVHLSPSDVPQLPWMPSTCAYRLLHEGKDLPPWHPLVTGDRKAMESGDHSITGKVISAEFVHPEGMEEHIIRWAEQ